jgi:hypothetical protein
MGKTSIICVILVFALLLEDGSSVRKKTKEEEKEDEEIQKAVNATLAAEEEKKRKEEEEKKEDGKKNQEDEKRKKNGTQDEKDKMSDKVKDRDEKKEDTQKQVGQGEDCPSCNSTCPEVKTCHPCDLCPEQEPCKKCPESPSCPPCKKCPSPEECLPCPVVNSTVPDLPACPEVPEMSLPVAMAIGAMAGVLFTGVATIIGLLLRYTSPIESGFVFLATVIVVWYLCSHYPETAREIGGRAATLLREAATALSHRVMEAIRHREQVGFPILILVSPIPNLSSMFQKGLH